MSNIGIDVSKAYLDVAWAPPSEQGQPSQPPARFENNPDGVDRLVQLLVSQCPERIVLEATGGYQRLAVAAMMDARLPVVVINPRMIRDFARAIGRLAKTDAIDAAVLAHYAQAVQPEIRPLPDEQARGLTELVTRRRQLIQTRTAESNRLPHAVDRRVKRSIQQMLDMIQQQLDDLDTQLQQVIQDSPVWQHKADLLTSVPGPPVFGQTTARKLLAQLPELGRATRQQIAALVGVAPINRDSGTLRGKRTTFGGRPAVRHALYMPTVVAIQHNPVIRAFYQRLLDNGKTKMVALIAAMRKLLTILNAVLRDQKLWRTHTVTT